MDSTPLFPEKREAKSGIEKPAISLYEVCQPLLDGRAARGKRYELAALLVVLVLANLAGMPSLLGASDWMGGSARAVVRTRAPVLETHAPQRPRTSMRWRAWTGEQVNAQFAAWLVRTEAQSRCGEEPSRLVVQVRGRSVHLATLGKALKGTGKQIDEGEAPRDAGGACV